MLAVPTSDVQPLPHQIRAVYGALLSPLRCGFCSPTTPAPGKAIMAGLYIKELILRDDVRRSLVVAPGGLARRIIEAGCTTVVVNPSKTHDQPSSTSPDASSAKACPQSRLA